MDPATYDKGRDIRSAVLGEAYVDNAIRNADSFTKNSTRRRRGQPWTSDSSAWGTWDFPWRRGWRAPGTGCCGE